MRHARRLALAAVAIMLLAACTGEPTPTPAPPPAGGTLTVAFLDIGQGDSILVRSPGGQTMLIDGGNSNRDATEVILPQLRAWGADRLDVMVATHPDADHVGGLPAVLENFPVTTVALTGQTHSTRVYERLLTDIRNLDVAAIPVRTGVTIPFDPAVRLEVLAPDENFVRDEDDANNASIVIRMTYGNACFLFTGDAEFPEEAAILSSGADLRCAVLKVEHHGSRSSTGAEFVRAVAPQIGIISASQGNPYGHPHQEVLDRLAAAGVQVFRTDQSGTITITTDGTTLNVETDR